MKTITILILMFVVAIGYSQSNSYTYKRSSLESNRVDIYNSMETMVGYYLESPIDDEVLMYDAYGTFIGSCRDDLDPNTKHLYNSYGMPSGTQVKDWMDPTKYKKYNSNGMPDGHFIQDEDEPNKVYEYDSFGIPKSNYQYNIQTVPVVPSIPKPNNSKNNGNWGGNYFDDSKFEIPAVEPIIWY